MLIEIKTVPAYRSLKRILRLRCDHCDNEFESDYTLGKAERIYHFCCRKCQQQSYRKGGILYDRIHDTMKSNIGDDYRKIIGAKILAASTSEQRIERAAIAKQTVAERYGVNSALQIKHVRAAALQKAAAPESVAKRKVTTKERFGVDSVLKLPKVHALCNTPESCLKRHETMKKNGSYAKSSQEDLFFDYLVLTYGAHDIERQKTMNIWPIDFYVKSIDTHIQFDGEYWHGLDRSLEEIEKFKTPRDSIIYRKYQIDREQDSWFSEQGLKLIRVTNKQFFRGDHVLKLENLNEQQDRSR